ncbi:MAG: hypothetical protein MHM6MM_000640 [Cercozoa sp. M6MM]
MERLFAQLKRLMHFLLPLATFLCFFGIKTVVAGVSDVSHIALNVSVHTELRHAFHLQLSDAFSSSSVAWRQLLQVGDGSNRSSSNSYTGTLYSLHAASRALETTSHSLHESEVDSLESLVSFFGDNWASDPVLKRIAGCFVTGRVGDYIATLSLCKSANTEHAEAQAVGILQHIESARVLFVEPADNTQFRGHHVLTAKPQLTSKGMPCHSHDHTLSSQLEQKQTQFGFLKQSRDLVEVQEQRRFDFTPEQASPLPHKTAKNSAETYFVELLIVNDISRLEKFDSLEDMLVGSAEIAYLATALFRANNAKFESAAGVRVQLVLTSQLTFSQSRSQPFDVPELSTGEVDDEMYLNNFGKWVATAMDQIPSHDVAVLMTAHDLLDATVGLAPLGGMCVSPGTSVAIAQTTNSANYNAAVIVHEMGHLFGMPHDSGACPESGYIMAAVGCSNCEESPSQFSPCSISAFADFVETNRDRLSQCFDNKPERSAAGACGDGFVDVSLGEQCDCGQEDCSHVDPCCNGATCRLWPNAQCSADQPCCDADTCTPVSANAKRQCRSVHDQCDIQAEMCDGVRAECPSDSFRVAGTTCADSFTMPRMQTTAHGPGVCYHGMCQSYAQQCAHINAYTTCDETVQHMWNTDEYCRTLVCREISAKRCTYFTTASGEQVQLNDGIQCGDNRQCRSGKCVDSAWLVQYSWHTDQWSECSRTCGDGVSTRSVTCTDESGSYAHDSMCAHKKRPATSKQCNPQACSNDASLRNVIADVGMLEEQNDGVFVISVSDCVGSINLRVDTTDSNARVSLDNRAFSAGSVSLAVSPWRTAPIIVKVVAEDGITQTQHSILIQRETADWNTHDPDDYAWDCSKEGTRVRRRESVVCTMRHDVSAAQLRVVPQTGRVLQSWQHSAERARIVYETAQEADADSLELRDGCTNALLAFSSWQLSNFTVPSATFSHVHCVNNTIKDGGREVACFLLVRDVDDKAVKAPASDFDVKSSLSKSSTSFTSAVDHTPLVSRDGGKSHRFDVSLNLEENQALFVHVSVQYKGQHLRNSPLVLRVVNGATTEEDDDNFWTSDVQIGDWAIPRWALISVGVALGLSALHILRLCCRKKPRLRVRYPRPRAPRQMVTDPSHRPPPEPVSIDPDSVDIDEIETHMRMPIPLPFSPSVKLNDCAPVKTATPFVTTGPATDVVPSAPPAPEPQDISSDLESDSDYEFLFVEPAEAENHISQSVMSEHKGAFSRDRERFLDLTNSNDMTHASFVNDSLSFEDPDKSSLFVSQDSESEPPERGTKSNE